jgi:hypothetical protein
VASALCVVPATSRAAVASELATAARRREGM